MSIRFCCGISRLEFIVLGLEEQASTAQQLKNHRLAWRAKQWPLVGKTLFSSIPPSIDPADWKLPGDKQRV